MNINEIIKNIRTVSDLYAEEHDINKTDEWYLLKLSEEIGELIQNYLKMTGQARANGVDPKTLKYNFDDEIADLFSHILLAAAHFKVDMDVVLKRKWLSHLPENKK